MKGLELLGMGGVYVVMICLRTFADQTEAFPVSGAAWSDAQWEQHCKDVRTTYNPTTLLSTETLTMKTENPRFLDFSY